MATSINPQEIEKFSKDSAEWWDEFGPFRPLHRLNPARLSYIREQVLRHYGLPEDSASPYTGLSVLDIGCGGGIICEPMARLGAKATGIDADINAIAVAKEHASKNGLAIDYQNIPAEKLDKQFDIVLALEILEHVENVDSFVDNCVRLCKPGGILIFSTLNRTPKSFALGIIAAEHVLRWVPRGTHQWKKFLRPSELARMLRKAGAREKDIKGIYYNAIEDCFKVSSEDISVNYLMTAEK